MQNWEKIFRHTMDEKYPLAPRNHDFLGNLGGPLTLRNRGFPKNLCPFASGTIIHQELGSISHGEPSFHRELRPISLGEPSFQGNLGSFSF
jgi:hypothetical protein